MANDTGVDWVASELCTHFKVTPPDFMPDSFGAFAEGYASGLLLWGGDAIFGSKQVKLANGKAGTMLTICDDALSQFTLAASAWCADRAAERKA